MKRYLLPPCPETMAALNALSNGVVSAVISKGKEPESLCFSLCLELTDGGWVQIEAASEDLEYRFEVFVLVAKYISAPTAGDPVPFVLNPPVAVMPLQTESWIDPRTPIKFRTLGTDPVMQFVSLPDAAPPTASVTCGYVGGVELTGSDGSVQVVATGSFPCSLHVGGYCEDRYFDRESYIVVVRDA